MAARDPARARALLEAEAAGGTDDVEVWRRLASLRRGAGELTGALTAIEAALAQAPYDFVTLMIRAGLLEQMGHVGAGEAYGRALAQRPAGALPPALENAAARGAGLYAAWQATLAKELADAAAPPVDRLDDAGRQRASRFISNITRRTKPYRSEPSHYHYPGLREIEFHDRAEFSWLEEWEAATDIIAAEFAALAAAESAAIVPYIQYADSAPLAQWRSLNQSPDWSSLHLLQRGTEVTANTRHCPQTMALLKRFPMPEIDGCGANAMFSLLAPQTRIPPHTGVANFRLVCHLPLIVPPSCWFRVGEQRREWRRGEAWVFDDTIEHEAVNDSDELRVIMIIDCWHPDVAPAERAAIAAIVGKSAFSAVSL